MAHAPFNMLYNFEGNSRTRPEQNLSGSSRKETRGDLLNRAHEERQKRQEQRLKMQSTLVIQSYTRGYLTRKREKERVRQSFDRGETMEGLREMLRKLLFFYDRDVDSERLCRLCQKVLDQHAKVLQSVDTDSALNWLLRRLLVVCLDGLSQPSVHGVALQCIDTFTSFANSRSKLETWPYLVSKGYFKYLRFLLDDPVSQTEQTLSLIQRPLLPSVHMQQVIPEFCYNFLCPNLTSTIKGALIPYLQKSQNFPYTEMIKFLNEKHPNFDSTASLFYCVLALEPTNYALTKDSVQVLACLSTNLHHLSADSVDLTEDSDSEEMDVSGGGAISLQDHMPLLNWMDRIRKYIGFFDEHRDDEEVLAACIQFCHNLLLIYNDSIRKYVILFTLSLNEQFLKRLWALVKRNESSILQNYSINLPKCRDHCSAVTVFCDMFAFYTETLTDSETADTSGTFTATELGDQAELLKSVALNLIDMAFPMCRTGTVQATRETLHLYYSVIKAVRVIYTLDLRRNFCKAGFWVRRKIHISQDLSRKNYLSKSLQPFSGTMSLVSEADDEEHLPPLSTIEQRCLAVLQQLPFLVDFNTRVLLLRDLCRATVSDDVMRIQREFPSDAVITIRRTHLYEDAFNKLSHDSNINLRQKLRIQFINSAGLEEAGIDGGGIFKEFLNEVLKTAFDPNRGFFVLTNDNTLYPNPNVQALVDNCAEHYDFVGRLIGKALFENILVDLPFAEFFLAKLLVDRVSAHYLQSLDPVLYRNLLYLRDYQGDVQDLGLDFTTVINDLGETKVVDLKYNGSNIPVTNHNRLEYIHKLANLKLNTQIRRQCAAFRNGIDGVVPLLWLKLFNHLELQVIIGGDMQEMDINDFRAHTNYGGEFHEEHQTIRLFWGIVSRFTDGQKKQLLKFVTSCPRPPLLGFKELRPPFCIQSTGTDGRMPTASTCLNLLKLPIVSDEEVLRQKLLVAIEQQAGFELS